MRGRARRAAICDVPKAKHLDEREAEVLAWFKYTRIRGLGFDLAQKQRDFGKGRDGTAMAA
jgi:hypothetical protein